MLTWCEGPVGPEGKQGTAGADGTPGVDGARGEDGSSVKIMGSRTDSSQLTSITPTPQLSDHLIPHEELTITGYENDVQGPVTVSWTHEGVIESDTLVNTR